MYVVVGAAGFIGRALVASLAADGLPVAAIDRRGDLPAAAVVRVQAELSDGIGCPSPAARLVDDVLRGAWTVFCLVGCPGVRDASPDVGWRRYRDNVLAVREVLRRTPPGVPLVVASSSSVYGGACHGGAVRPSCEDDPLRPAGGYARSKVLLERACAARAGRAGPVAVVRPFTVAGEGQRPDMAVARWLTAARGGRPLEVLGSPARVRDVTDVRDVVRGLRAAAERRVEGVVNLGTGVGHTLEALAAAVSAAVGVPAQLLVRPAGPEEVPVTLADTRRCERLLGFVPSTDLEQLVRRQAAAVDQPRAGAVAA